MEKISVVIPIYNPDPDIYSQVKNALANQTIPVDLIEITGMTESQGLNHGIKKAKSEIVVTMNQDCIPQGNDWLETLIGPFKDPKVVASVSDTVVMPKELWKSSDIISKALTLKEQRTIRSALDARGCAYRKKVIIEAGLFNEDPNLGGIDDDIYIKMKSRGIISYPGNIIYHWHPYTGKERLLLEYKYAKGSGAVTKLFGPRLPSKWKGILKATPILGLIGIWKVFPVKRSPQLFLLYLLISPTLHLIYLTGFWKGFLRMKKSSLA